MRSKPSDQANLTSSLKLSQTQRRAEWAFVCEGGRPGVRLNQSASLKVYQTVGIAASEHVGQRCRNGL